MSMDDLERALDLVRTSPDAHFIGPRDPGVVRAAEDVLGVSFPPTYRRFVSELGAGGLHGREFYGVVDTNFQESSVPNGIWLTLDERRHFGLPARLVLIGDTGAGEWYALDTAGADEDGECPVVIWVAGQSQEADDLEVVAPDFGSFMWEAIREG